MNAKYVIVECRDLELPIVFNPILNHGDVVNCLVNQGNKVVAAGSCSLGDTGKWSCWGHSVTLNVKSRFAEDADILNRKLAIDI